jgi:aminoglycoside 6'-N-acetyltransferase I
VYAPPKRQQNGAVRWRTVPVELKRLTPHDAHLLDRVADDVFDEAIVPERVRRYLDEANHLMIVAIDEGVVVAQCAAVVHRHPDKPTELYIDEVGTAPSHQRRGIARRMMQAMFDWGRELGCEESWLGTELDNVAANALYRGFDGQFAEMAYYEFRL